MVAFMKKEKTIQNADLCSAFENSATVVQSRKYKLFDLKQIRKSQFFIS